MAIVHLLPYKHVGTTYKRALKRFHHSRDVVVPRYPALFTLIAVVVFASLNYAQAAAEASIDQWRNGLLQDHEWWQEIFKESYLAVKNLGVEDFSNYPPPTSGGNRIPLTRAVSVQRAAQVCADAAVSNFRAKHPFLSAIFSIRNDVPAEDIQKDVADFFPPRGTDLPTRKRDCDRGSRD